MTLQPRDRMALALLLVIAVVAGPLALLVRPQRNHASELADSIAGKRTELAAAQRELHAAARPAAPAPRQTAAVRTARSAARAVPATEAVPALLRTLERTAERSGIALLSVQPAGAATPPPTKAAAGDKGAPASATPAPAPAPSDLQLSIEGDFEHVNGFFHRLDRMVEVDGERLRASGRLIDVQGIQISGGSKLSVEISASVYQLPEAAGAATEAAR